jgi:hypothetical protein
VYGNRHYSYVYTHGATVYDVSVRTLRTALSVRYIWVGSAPIIGLRKWTDPVLFNTGRKLMVPTVTCRLQNRMNYVNCLSSPKFLDGVFDVRKDKVHRRTNHEGPDGE